MKDSGQIEVSKKTLLHISEGIYRTEGSAIKELISNAFDAKAKKVIISTNYPQFDILTCQDDGIGMTEEEFLRIVKGGIGDSPKAYHKPLDISAITTERPIIGKLGIGILAIAQICRSFTIISHHPESKTAFKGKLIFRTDVDKVAKEEKTKENYEIGTWQLEEQIEYDCNRTGVLIFTKDLRQSFIKRFKEDKQIQENNSTPLNFDKLIEGFYFNNYRMVKEQGAYFELIWELCNLLPIPYHEGLPINNNAIKQIQQFSNTESNDGLTFLKSKQDELINYDFNVIFDDIKLYRPIKLPYPLNNKNSVPQQCQIFYIEYDNIVRKRKLQFYGYFFSQEMAIKPRDLKGLQIRIKNVGIGSHDATFLKYDKIESPRDNWLTGEIYVNEGLESALNIDRDSFNENDEHYFVLRREVHAFLEKTVFPTISSFQRKRNKAKKESTIANSNRAFQKNIIGSFKKNYADYEVIFENTDSIKFNNSNKTISIPIKTTDGTFKSRFDVLTSSLMNIIDSLREKGTTDSLIEKYIKEFTSIIIGN